MKVRIATTSLAGCFGCHMSFLDIDERLFELTEIAEFDRSPLTDIKHCGPCDIALIEGGVCNSENVHVLRELRANAKILIAVGACAINGGLPAMRNHLDVGEILRKVYHDPSARVRPIPNDPELPPPLDKVYPLNQIVRVDYLLPGCPPSGDAIWKFLTDLILGRIPRLDSRLFTTIDGNAAMTSLETAAHPENLRRIAIEPVTRVEGHGKVTLLLDEAEPGAQARLHIVEFRGFEAFIEGRPYWEVPVLVQRLCGICPVSHHLAAAKAMDLIAGYGALTPTAEKLRRLLHYGQMVQSHALHFFHLSSPDLLFGFESEVGKRNVSASPAHPDLARHGRADAQVRAGGHQPRSSASASTARAAFPAA